MWLALHHGPLPEHTRELGVPWLGRIRYGHPGWSLVLEALWASDPTEDLRSRAYHWMNKVTPRNPRWHRVWLLLWQAPDRDGTRLAAVARRWLERAPGTHTGRALVQQALSRS